MSNDAALKQFCRAYDRLCRKYGFYLCSYDDEWVEKLEDCVSLPDYYQRHLDSVRADKKRAKECAARAKALVKCQKRGHEFGEWQVMSNTSAGDIKVRKCGRCYTVETVVLRSGCTTPFFTP